MKQFKYAKFKKGVSINTQKDLVDKGQFDKVLMVFLNQTYQQNSIILIFIVRSPQ